MLKYARIATYSSEPWKNFEVKKHGRLGEWYDWCLMKESDSFCSYNEYRIIVRKKSINGISFNEPEIFPLENGQTYWYPCVDSVYFVASDKYTDDKKHKIRLDAGVIHINREEAKTHAKAIFCLRN
jgi:hypothetical protein